MPTLKKIPGKLTVGEALERLKKNPNDPDPEVQRFKKSMEMFYSSFAPRIAEITQFSSAAVAAIQPAIRLSNIAIAASLPPPSFFENIRRINESFERLTEPMRILADTIAKIQAPLIYPVLPRLDYVPTVPEPEIVIDESLPTVKDHKEELLEEQTTLLRELVRLQKEAPQIKGKPFFFDDESNTFLIKTIRWKALNLSTERLKDDMAVFFKTLLEILKQGGVETDGYLQVAVSIPDLIERLKLMGITEATRAWIKSTRSNLVHKKLVPAKMEKIIVLSVYNDRVDGFYFRVKLPVDSLEGF